MGVYRFRISPHPNFDAYMNSVGELLGARGHAGSHLGRLLRNLLLFRPTLPLCGCDPFAGFGAHGALYFLWTTGPYVVAGTGEKGAGLFEGGDFGIDC